MRRRIFLLTSAALPAWPQGQGEEGFAPLFDGRTLRNWSVQQGPESAFYVRDGAIIGHVESQFPAWLRSERQYENFDFRAEFFLQGWMDGGVYLHAPEHGRNTWCGMQVKIFHAPDAEPRSNSMGAIYPLIAPRKVNVRNQGEWNSLRVVCDWPRFQVWVNDELVQDLDLERDPELRCRLHRGYLGLSTLGYPIRFRNLRIRELPATEKWEQLYETAEDFAQWFVSESNPKVPARFEAIGGVLRGDGLGHLATREKYRDFQLQLYIRGPKHHNGGVLFRSSGKGLKEARHYEIQLHNVEEAHYPTGSLYHYQRARYPRIEDEQWYLFQMWVQGRSVRVRINGENVMEYDRLENLDEGHLELQAHQAGKWIEYKHIWVKRL